MNPSFFCVHFVLKKMTVVLVYPKCVPLCIVGFGKFFYASLYHPPLIFQAHNDTSVLEQCDRLFRQLVRVDFSRQTRIGSEIALNGVVLVPRERKIAFVSFTTRRCVGFHVKNGGMMVMEKRSRGWDFVLRVGTVQAYLSL